MGIGENAGYHNFLLFPQCFQKPSFSGSLKSGLCGKELSLLVLYSGTAEQDQNACI